MNHVICCTHYDSNDLPSRQQCKDYVLGISGNSYKGFEVHCDAEHAYILAYAMDGICILPAHGKNTEPHLPAAPAPEPFVQALRHVDNNFLGVKWLAVFKGQQLGVYPVW